MNKTDTRYNGPEAFNRAYLQGAQAACHPGTDPLAAAVAMIQGASAPESDDFDKGYALGFVKTLLDAQIARGGK